jgi:hypothetical protein
VSDVLRDLEVGPLKLPRHHAQRQRASRLKLGHRWTVIDPQRLEVEPASNLGHSGKIPFPAFGILAWDFEERALHVHVGGRRQAGRLGAAQDAPQ